MSRPSDDDLRRIFAAARRADEEQAPAFRRVLERGAAHRPAKPARIARALVAAAGAAVIVIAVWSRHRAPEIAVARVETWTPPTQFLLEASFTKLFDTMPTLANPVPDYSPLLTKEKGRKS